MIISGTTGGAAGVFFPLATETWQFLRAPSLVSLGVWPVSVSALSALRNYSFYVAGRKVVDQAIIWPSIILIEGVRKTGPKFPSDFYVIDEPGMAGDRLVLEVSLNATVFIGFVLIITEVV